MDPWLIRRLRYPVVIHPHTGTFDGDKTFGIDFDINTLYIIKDSVVVNANGDEVKSKASFILNGADISKVHVEDEVTLPIIGRNPIIAISPYLSFKHEGYESVEVFV